MNVLSFCVRTGFGVAMRLTSVAVIRRDLPELDRAPSHLIVTSQIKSSDGVRRTAYVTATNPPSIASNRARVCFID
jgi:hypothetical protein